MWARGILFVLSFLFMQLHTSKSIGIVVGLSLVPFLSLVFIAGAHEAGPEHAAEHAAEAKASTTSPGVSAIPPDLIRGTSTLQTEQAERAAALAARQASSTVIKETRAVNIGERQAALDAARQQRILNLGANISNRMEAAIERLYTIIGRFEGRIAKLKAAGVETGPAEEKLREAAQKLSEARSTLSTIDTVVYTATTATEPKAQWQMVRATYTKAGQDIRASHQALRSTLSLLKTAIGIAVEQKSQEVLSTTTATGTDQ